MHYEFVVRWCSQLILYLVTAAVPVATIASSTQSA